MRLKDKVILIGGVVLSAIVSITVMWGVWTGIFIAMEVL